MRLSIDVQVIMAFFALMFVLWLLGVFAPLRAISRDWGVTTMPRRREQAS